MVIDLKGVKVNVSSKSPEIGIKVSLIDSFSLPELFISSFSILSI